MNLPEALDKTALCVYNAEIKRTFLSEFKLPLCIDCKKSLRQFYDNKCDTFENKRLLISSFSKLRRKLKVNLIDIVSVSKSFRLQCEIYRLFSRILVAACFSHKLFSVIFLVFLRFFGFSFAFYQFRFVFRGFCFSL